MYAALALLLLSAPPAPPAVGEAALLKTFREEFVAIAPGSGKFPAKVEIVDGKRTRTLAPAGSFAINKYEVPQNLWEAVMGSNPSRWQGKRNSVEMISLEEAREFCKRATKKMRAEYLIESTQEIRLPTDVEWEYAARAGTTTRYSFGDDVKLLDDYAWHTGNAAGNDPAVGEKKPSAWGLYDMHGYLWEWCDSPTPAGAPPTEASLRGGSWKDAADLLTSDSRRAVPPDTRDDAVGLRCVLVDTTGAAGSK